MSDMEGRGSQQAPPSLEKLLGVPEDSVISKLVLSEENINGNLRVLVESTMADDLVSIQEIDGRKFKVSKGSEHFSDMSGLLDEAFKSGNQQFFGFRLYQEIQKDGDRYTPMLLVQNGNVDSPIAAINPGTGHITEGNGIYFIDDQEKVRKCLEIVGAIKLDSVERAEIDEELNRDRRKNVYRKTRRGVVFAALLGAAALFGPDFVEDRQAQYQDYMDDRAQRQEEEREREEAQRQEREEAVREFDSSNNIGGVPEFLSGTAGIATASDQFEGQNVPNFEDEDISEDLAHDTSNPREVELDFGDDDSGCFTLDDVSIRTSDSISAIHNGGERRLYEIFASPADDSLQICENGTIGDGNDSSGAAGDRMIFQVNPGPR